MQPKVFREDESGLEYLKVDNNSKKAICILHGYGASMYDLYSLKDAMSNSSQFDWYFMQAPIPLNMGGMQGAAWFPIDMVALEKAMQSGGHRKFSDVYPESLHSSVQKMAIFCRNTLVKYDEIHLGGFSQGAMVSSHVMGEDISNLKSLSLLSGNLVGAKKIEEKLSGKKQFRFFQSHGAHDPVLAYDQAKDLFEHLKLLGHQGEFVSFNGGHEIPLEVISKWNLFLGSYK